MTRYRCQDFHPIIVGDKYGMGWIEGPRDAAIAFADRIAKVEFGKRGYCHRITEQLRVAKGSSITYQAFIAIRTKNGCQGKDVMLTVYIDN